MQSDAPPSAGLYNILGWFETNKKRIAVWAGVAALAGLVAGLWAWNHSQRDLEAEEALSSVRQTTVPGEASAPGTGDALVKVAAQYANTPAAAKALVRAGSVYFDEGNYAKARDQFNAVLNDYGKSPWVPQAVFGLASCLDAENKPAEAITKYKDFISGYGNDPAAELAKLNLARVYVQNNQPQLAFDLLKKMTDNDPNKGYNPSAAEAQQKLRDLLVKNPALNFPPSAPQITPQPPTRIVLPPTNAPGGAPQIQIRPGPAQGPNPTVIVPVSNCSK